MPKLPPPPRIAQKSSGSLSRSARTSAAVGGHELDGDDAVRGQAVAAREPAEAAAEGVADDADVGRGAGEAGEAVLGRGEA